MNAVITKIVSLFSTDKIYFTAPAEQPEANVRVIHNDHQVVDLEKYLIAPRKLKQSIKLYQLDSFVAYIIAYAPLGTDDPHFGRPVVFVSLYNDQLTVKSALDYHKSHAEPTQCVHEVSLSCERDESFKIWFDDDDDWMSQKQMLNLLKKNNRSLNKDWFPKLLEAIQKITSESKLSSTQMATKSDSQKSVYFETLETFEFSFKPYYSMPFVYSIKADLYVQLDDNNRIQLKYSIRNPSLIFQQVADDLRKEFKKIENVEKLLVL